jgi:hypothetical protein
MIDHKANDDLKSYIILRGAQAQKEFIALFLIEGF